MSEITEDQRLQALGMFAVAKQAVMDARRYELAACRTLGIPEGSHFSDAVWGTFENWSLEVFNEALKREGLEIKKEAA